jgi:hypothetical protein
LLLDARLPFRDRPPSSLATRWAWAWARATSTPPVMSSSVTSQPSQSNKSYAGLYATAIRLRTELAVEYYAFHLWPHGTAHLREIGQRLEAVAPEETELYDVSRWRVLDQVSGS